MTAPWRVAPPLCSSFPRMPPEGSTHPPRRTARRRRARRSTTGGRGTNPPSSLELQGELDRVVERQRAAFRPHGIRLLGELGSGRADEALEQSIPEWDGDRRSE